ncbi:MAG: hypothetical protein K6E14_07395 [Paludibacteraceae bacterium]|nr:hypothetical protein [Paludibacteraceae bacterium]
MVEVEDLNHYGVGLFDFCVGDISFFLFSLAFRLARREWGKGVPPFGIPLFLNSASGIFRIYKDRYSNHRFDICKDNHLFEIIFVFSLFFFARAYALAEVGGTRAFRPLHSLSHEIQTFSISFLQQSE